MAKQILNQFIKKLINILVNNQTSFRNFFAIFLYKLNLIPDEYKGRVNSIYKKQQYGKKFLKFNLKYNDLGFYYLDPIPTKVFLNKYYEEIYWQSRSDKNYPIRLRDIEHYKLLKKIYPDFDKDSKKVLNFGAGHGGLSILLYVANHKIYNFDFGQTNNLFSERWNQVNDLCKIDSKFDLIYGSHSLEHVQNIKETMKKFDEISHENTIYFFEVPNCINSKKIAPPHTYYFTRKFFYNYFEKYDYCETLDNSGIKKNDEGVVIRFLSKSRVKKNLLK
jgi:2-polyprenyl-3-methyl-5-hydroxy-6-metoxy-1,4-benzoquinol methylase